MVKGEGRKIFLRVGTYAAGGKASQPWWRRQCGPDGRRARTSSGPRQSRRPERSRWTCHHRTGCGNRRRRPGPCWTCTGRPASRGAHPWRRWGGWGGGHPWKRKKEDVSRAVPWAIFLSRLWDSKFDVGRILVHSLCASLSPLHWKTSCRCIAEMIEMVVRGLG